MRSVEELNTSTNSSNEIVVLINFHESSDNAVEYAKSIVETPDTVIHLFHVLPSDELITNESQLNALNAINEKRREAEKRLGEIRIQLEDLGISARYSCEIGVVRKEILKFLEETNPQSVILGKKTGKVSLRNHVLRFLLKKYKGTIITVDRDDNSESPEEKFIPAVFDNG